MTLATLNAHKLSRIIDQVAPHMGDEDTPAINGIRFDCNGTVLHAVATDRYTLAAARANVREETEPFAFTIPETDTAYLRGWLSAHEGAEHIEISEGGAGVVFTSKRGTLVITARDDTFPDWRALLATSLQNDLSESPITGLATSMLARWKAAGLNVRVWQSTSNKPMVVVGDNLLGLHMPARYTDSDRDREAILANWAASLGEGHERVQLRGPQEQVSVPKMAEDMLRQALRSTSQMFSQGIDMDTDQGRMAFNAWVSSGIYAWSAYRILDALKTADPDLAEETVRELNDELESGEIGEWAWDAAKGAGHDPQQWHDDYEAHLKKLAEKRAAEAAVNAA